jgi:ABC-2 type transport system ATP-binding protein
MTDQLTDIEVLEPAPEPPRDGPAPAVETNALAKRYGKLHAVKSLDLAIPAGEVFGLIGPNGAGKTTTFSILASLLKPSSGRAVVAGVDVRRDPAKVRAKVGYMPDILGVYDSLQVDEYLRFFASSYRIRRAEQPALIDGLLELVDLTGKRTAMVNSLSRGMKQRLSLARALVHDPEVLILDEPASGLDPRARVELRELLHELRSMGKTLLVSSHILSELEEMCTLIGIMEAGDLLVSGTPADILARFEGTRRVRVRFSDGEIEEHHVADDLEQQALLRALVERGDREVVEFAQVTGGLEELFLRITEGVVQ